MAAFISYSKWMKGTTKAKVAHEQTVEHGQYKQWNEEQMAYAVKAVTDGSSIRRAAEEYDVPRSTLGDRISGRVVPGSTSGPPKYLSTQEEEELVQFLIDCASIGYPRGRLEVIAMVQYVCHERGIERVVTHGWWESFCRRHPDVTLRVTAPLSSSRAKSTDVNVINKYFDMFQATMEEYDLLQKPCHLFNIDETGLPISPKPLKMVCRKGSKNPCCIDSGGKSQITVVGCVSAAGYCVPPMVVYNRKSYFVSAEMVQGEIPGTAYGFSSKGWMDQDLFGYWLNHFLKYAPPIRPLLLLLDGHSSHYCPSMIRQAAEHKVILFTLPPNTTHLTQPLDKGIFGPLKTEWRKVCHDYIVENPGKVVTVHCFVSLFAKAWTKSMTMKNIMASFRTTGIFPLDRNKVLSLVNSVISTESPVSKPGGLTYLPLLSPMPSPKQKPVSDPDFSDAEIALFIERFQKNYKGNDDRYNLWLDMYHPASVKLDGAVTLDSSNFHTPSRDHKQLKSKSTATSVAAVAKPSNVFEKLFTLPSPPPKLPTLKEKGSSRVLTSAEGLKLLDEKKKKKEAAEQKKIERQKKKEEKDLKVQATISKTVDQVQTKDKNPLVTKANSVKEVQATLEAGNQVQTRRKPLAKTAVKGKTETGKPVTVNKSQNDCSIIEVHCPSKPLSRTQIRKLKLAKREKVRVHKVSFKLPSLKEIVNGEWLNDTHIKAVCDLLKTQFSSVCGLHDPKLGEDLSFPDTDFPFTQILHAGDHWLTVQGISPSLARTYDTMNYSSSGDVQLQIAAIMRCEADTITLEVQSTQKQRGPNDCALFAIAYAVDLCCENDPTMLWYNQHKMREHLVECLQEKKMRPFPSRVCRPSKPLTISFAVYCVCRLTDLEDENDSMARCENCHQWYHQSCEDIPEIIFKDSSIDWQCSHCRASNDQ